MVKGRLRGAGHLEDQERDLGPGVGDQRIGLDQDRVRDPVSVAGAQVEGDPGSLGRLLPAAHHAPAEDEHGLGHGVVDPEERRPRGHLDHPLHGRAAGSRGRGGAGPLVDPGPLDPDLLERAPEDPAGEPVQGRPVAGTDEPQVLGLRPDAEPVPVRVDGDRTGGDARGAALAGRSVGIRASVRGRRLGGPRGEEHRPVAGQP
jgi:hypothetical protein